MRKATRRELRKAKKGWSNIGRKYRYDKFHSNYRIVCNLYGSCEIQVRVLWIFWIKYEPISFIPRPRLERFVLITGTEGYNMGTSKITHDQARVVLSFNFSLGELNAELKHKGFDEFYDEWEERERDLKLNAYKEYRKGFNHDFYSATVVLEKT
jgi:hypothetical protein